MLLAVMVAVAVGLALLNGDRSVDQRAAALAFAIAAGTFGPLLTYFRFLRRSPARSPAWDRLAYAGITALCMIPAFAIASEVPGDALVRMMIAPLAALFVCDWTKRIEAGRFGEVQGSQAIWPAVIGLIAASIATGGDYGLTAACVCATMSLLTQAGAAMWPSPAGGVAAVGAPGRREQPVPGAPTGAVRAAASGPKADGTDLSAGAASAPTVEGVPRSSFVRAFFGILTTLAVAGSLGALFVLAISPPDCADDCSGLLFATLAGVAWLPFMLSKALYRYKMPFWRATLRPLILSASLCLVAGMIALLVFQPLRGDELGGAVFGLVFGSVIALVALGVRGRRSCAGAGGGSSADKPSAPDGAEAPVLIDAAAPSFVGRAANAGLSLVGKTLLLIGLVLALGHDTLLERVQPVLIRNHISSELVEEGLPPPLLLGIALLGSLLVVVARRPAGGAHMLRGALGCALTLGAAVMAVGPAAGALHELLSSDWTAVDWTSAAPPLAAVAVPLAVAFLLLTWPQASRNKTVVV